MDAKVEKIEQTTKFGTENVSLRFSQICIIFQDVLLINTT